MTQPSFVYACAQCGQDIPWEGGFEHKCSRPTWDQYFLTIAGAVSMRATCPRKKVGAVLVDVDHHIISTGYNGSKPGEPHCTEAGCTMMTGPDGVEHCMRTIHAEINTLNHLPADTPSERLVGASLYVTCTPCPGCLEYAAMYGVKRVVFGEEYP